MSDDTRGADAPRSERKSFLRILTSLAWADGVADERELQQIHLAASELSVALGERDLEGHDLDQLADGLTHPELRSRLLDELATLAAADEEVAQEELSTIRYFANAWGVEPPALEGVDWANVPDLTPEPDEGADA
ncbi:MAG: TerB family tellurite resistance protein [Planctomycetes bacterium]|nr:TerB family tellurite resistance protein [Planctomycetota bacterium]